VVQRFELPEGEHLDLIQITRDATHPTNSTAVKSLAEIAALPLQGPSASPD
jgi:hypothetical protein